MEKQVKRHIRFWAPGSFVANDWDVEVEKFDPARVKWPDNAYSFTQHQREDIVEGETRFKGETKQIGPRYYHPDSKVETLEQARVNPNASRILIGNMERNNYAAVVWSRWGNWPQRFEQGHDEVLGAR